MKKVIVGLLICAFMLSGVTTYAESGRGGVMGFIAGCCFGVRAGAAYNDGKEIHWREWIGLIIPIVPAVWNGIEGANGVTTKELASRYGAMYY